jgi:hypothetical protein
METESANRCGRLKMDGLPAYCCCEVYVYARVNLYFKQIRKQSSRNIATEVMESRLICVNQVREGEGDRRGECPLPAGTAIRTWLQITPLLHSLQ